MNLSYKRLEHYLDVLSKDIYPQPEDEGHTDWARDVIEKMSPPDIRSVLDAGCGNGFCKDLFKNDAWVGVTLNPKELKEGREQGRDIRLADFSFLPFDRNSFHLVFARHVLEHSPMPLLTLMEWHWVSQEWLMCILPAADYWGEGGDNHYYVLPKENWWYLFDRAGWKVVDEEEFMTSDPLFMKHYLPEQTDRSKVHFPGRPKAVELRYLLRKK